MSFLRACSALAVAVLLFLLGAVLLGILFFALGSSEPGEAYLSDDGIAFVPYHTIEHSTERPGEVRLLPFAEALAQAEEDFGAPFKAAVTNPRRVFPVNMIVTIKVPESAYPLGLYPTVSVQMVLDAHFLPGGTVDPAQEPLQEADANIWLEVTHPVEGLHPPNRRVPLREVESPGGVPVFIPTYDGVDATRFYWLDGDTQYELWHFHTATHTREEILALVDLIASQ